MGFLDKLIKNTVKQVTNEAERDARNAANQAVGNAVNNALGGLFGTNRPAGTANTAPAGSTQSYTAPSAAPESTAAPQPKTYSDMLDLVIDMQEEEENAEEESN